MKKLLTSLDFSDYLIIVGLLLVGIGLGFFDWRIGVTSVGAVIIFMGWRNGS